ncbi:hypothetical protein FG386_000231 [Cryptosporidium ryanae]|uniref:uncharacterized protein n=1 Tax=Cryptosporidium ryanae TaxID=515981 RepID=UPI00351AAD80|nr:hypothetical protein FG386_000231 [Cryptosporidium ryanae]
MECKDEDYDLLLRKRVYTALLINYSVKVLAWVIIFLLTFLCVCVYVEYYNGFKGNSLIGIFNINLLIFSLKHNMNNIFLKNEVTIEIVGMRIMETETLKNIISNRDMNAEIFKNVQSSHKERVKSNVHFFIDFKVRDSYFEFNDSISNEILTGEKEPEDNSNELSENNVKYIIYVSFNNCQNEKFRDTLNLYNGRYSIFCLSKETSSGEFLILLNDIIEIWFTKFINKGVSEIFEYNTIDLYINNFIDTRTSLIENTNLKQGKYYLIINEKEDKSELLFNNFLVQIREIFNFNIHTQNKYLNLSENEVSAFLEDNYTKLYRLFNVVSLNKNNYSFNDDSKFSINLVNYYYSESSYSKKENKEYCTNIRTDNGFLLNCLDINNDKSSNKALISLIKYIRNLLLNDNYQTNETYFEFKSKLGNKYTINTFIKQINKTLLFTDWQVSLFKIIHSKYRFENTLSNINKFLSTLRFYNIYKLPKHIVIAIVYLNKQLSDIVKEKRIKSSNLYSVLAQDSYNLLFNGDIVNHKTYNYDLISAVCSPVIAPLIFIIFITLFRIIKFSNK